MYFSTYCICKNKTSKKAYTDMIPSEARGLISWDSSNKSILYECDQRRLWQTCMLAQTILGREINTNIPFTDPSKISFMHDSNY